MSFRHLLHVSVRKRLRDTAGNASVEWVVLTAAIVVMMSVFFYGIWGEGGERGLAVANMITAAFDAFQNQQ